MCLKPDDLEVDKPSALWSKFANEAMKLMFVLEGATTNRRYEKCALP